MNKFQVFFCDLAGVYHFANFVSLSSAVIYFGKCISLPDCLLCDLRLCGSNERFATYRNYKHLKIKGL